MREEKIKIFILFLFSVEVDGELVEVTVEFGLDFGEGVGGALVGRGLVGPVGVHDEPRAVVDVVELLAQRALVGRVALHQHHVRRHRDVRRAVAVALHDLVVAGVAGRLEADRAVLAADGRLVEVRDTDVGFVVPLLLVVLLEHEGIVEAEVVPRARGVLVARALGALDLVVVHDGGRVEHALERGVLVEGREIAGPLADVVGLVGELLVLVGEVDVEVAAAGAEERRDGKDGRSLRAAEHFVCFLFFCKKGNTKNHFEFLKKKKKRTNISLRFIFLKKFIRFFFCFKFLLH
jgi:hypothetical protein